jgi:hypothetical protein
MKLDFLHRQEARCEESCRHYITVIRMSKKDERFRDKYEKHLGLSDVNKVLSC